MQDQQSLLLYEVRPRAGTENRSPEAGLQKKGLSEKVLEEKKREKAFACQDNGIVNGFGGFHLLPHKALPFRKNVGRGGERESFSPRASRPCQSDAHS